MHRKRTILISILLLTIIAAIILSFAGKPAAPVLILGGLTLFIVFGAYSPPEKHKTFGYRDQQRAMRAFDRTDLLEFTIGRGKRKKKKSQKLD